MRVKHAYVLFTGRWAFNWMGFISGGGGGGAASISTFLAEKFQTCYTHLFTLFQSPIIRSVCPPDFAHLSYCFQMFMGTCSPPRRTQAYGQFFAGRGSKPFAQKFFASYPNFYETVVYERKRGPYDATTQRTLAYEGGQIQFFRVNTSKFERKLCRHKQTFLEKLPPQLYQIKMKFVMIKVAMTSDRSCHSNKMTSLPTAIICSNIFWHRELFLQNCSRELFSPIRSPRCS